MKTLHLCWLALILASPLSAKSLQITIPTASITINYEKPVRLEQVFGDIIENTEKHSPTTYPLSNQLFNLDREAEAQTLKHDVLERLRLLAQNDRTLVSSVGILVEQIKRWDIGYREPLVLDYDQIRIKKEYNPLIFGSYELLIPGRDESLIFEGLLFSPQKVPLLPELKLSDYLLQVNRLSSSHPSYVWVIYPDGEYTRVGYAYWNDEKTSLAPGTHVFLGLNSDNKEHLNLEEQIVRLITMRKSL